MHTRNQYPNKQQNPMTRPHRYAFVEQMFRMAKRDANKRRSSQHDANQRNRHHIIGGLITLMGLAFILSPRFPFIGALYNVHPLLPVAYGAFGVGTGLAYWQRPQAGLLAIAFFTFHTISNCINVLVFGNLAALPVIPIYLLAAYSVASLKWDEDNLKPIGRARVGEEEVTVYIGCTRKNHDGDEQSANPPFSPNAGNQQHGSSPSLFDDTNNNEVDTQPAMTDTQLARPTRTQPPLEQRASAEVGKRPQADAWYRRHEHR